MFSDKIFKVFPCMGLCKTSDPRRGANFEPRAIINNFGRGPLDEAIYQISKTWAFWFQIRRFFQFSVKQIYFSSCDLDMQWIRTVSTTLKEDQPRIILVKFGQ